MNVSETRPSFESRPTVLTGGQMMHGLFLQRLAERQQRIYAWLDEKERSSELPLYSSVDIRDAGFKAAAVDTNLFPAGFNNLCEHGLQDAVQYFRDALVKRVPHGRRVLIITEEHTRNLWYLENVRILQDILNKAGFETTVASFLNEQPPACTHGEGFVILPTAGGATLTIHCLATLLKRIENDETGFDLVILNNDLMAGVPRMLKEIAVPIYPSLEMGWHARLKSHHFCHMQDLVKEFARIMDLDPWFFSCLFAVVDQVNVHEDAGRRVLFEAAQKIHHDIQTKYKQHGIDEKPFLVVKADAGTYGMGVTVFENPEDILVMNRRTRNKLRVGKQGRINERFIIQEGVPTIHLVHQQVSEVVIYQVDNNLIGGFYRTHPEKGVREALNTKGMGFYKMCPHVKKYGECGVHHDINLFDLYRILARIAGLAAAREAEQERRRRSSS